MAEIELRTVAKNGLKVTTIGLGGTGLGNMYRAVDTEAAIGTVHAAYENGIRYFDTAPVYGFGVSETRLGLAIQFLPRADIVISSKIGYDLVPIAPDELKPTLWEQPGSYRAEFDYSRDAVMRSLEGTLKRLGTDYVDMVSIHDPDEALHFQPGEDPFARSRFREAMDGAYPALDALRSQGVIKAVGVGINQWQMLSDFVVAGTFDYFLLAGRYTLLEQEPLATLLPLCEQRGTKIIIGGPYNSGILATGAVAGATFNTRLAPEPVLERVRRIEAICADHKVSLPAAALQFPLGHPAVASVIPGARSVGELKQNLGYLRQPIPPALWTDLRQAGLIDPAAPLPAS
ncbi:aldo/keto reductase [Kaistia dalseonensis]|uniref:D-threo-aldose 1-dehydrogenase n=1 Tax=Kaistia dalseonensis TaxID=410840 RepID=A0ABU0H470_9HYPH|nr:aldo/keto reductase [Kaistia dalseonensis]MCX5494526.1 aldo/keto reductase [Kaistia dalseonensis]MDQ0437105.1 D-threo-aldose 1-dehydrogenase [Kaistia dalseonensis]